METNRQKKNGQVIKKNLVIIYNWGEKTGK
jgi:hypothetical protein